MDNKKNIVIVGQGLAGSVLALMLEMHGHNVTVIDNSHKASSSMVAAGMWNPISFVRHNSIWLASEMLESMYMIYPELEKHLNAKFFHPTDLARIFPDNKSANDWDEKSLRPEVSQFLTDKEDKVIREHLIQPHGHSLVTQTGWLDMPCFLNATKEYLSKKNKLVIKEFTEVDAQELLEKQPDTSIIYCTGWQQKHSLFDSWVRVIPHKGQLLTLLIDNLPLKHMVHFGKFLIPLGPNQYKLGATHELEYSTTDITQEAQQELLAELKKIYMGNVQVLNQTSGLRPTMHDRKPVIGFHPLHSQIGLFNGFGSRGVMMVPYFANQFIEHICNKTELNKEANILRYHKK